MSNIKNVVSEKIESDPNYHIMVRRDGKFLDKFYDEQLGIRSNSSDRQRTA